VICAERESNAMAHVFRAVSESPADTAAIGYKLGRLLESGDIVCLRGELGAGKTVLARGIAAGMGADASRVASPTFTLAREYSGRRPIYHLDLYRLSGPDDVEDAGLTEYIGGDGVALIEWPQVYRYLNEIDRLDVSITAPGAGDTGDTGDSGDRRELEFRAHGARYESILEAMGGC
jgi:tRNA threonylcarbamoyladenosine biosynthesis protein TsaE